MREALDYKSLPDCYDPCFLVPLFSHLLAPGMVYIGFLFEMIIDKCQNRHNDPMFWDK